MRELECLLFGTAMAAKPHLKTTFIRKNQCISPSPARYGAAPKLSSRNEPTHYLQRSHHLPLGRGYPLLEPKTIPLYRPNLEIPYLFRPKSKALARQSPNPLELTTITINLVSAYIFPNYPHYNASESYNLNHERP